MDESQYKGAKFIGIIGHESVSHNGSKTTVYFLQVQVDNAMYVVRHRYHDFKDFYDKLISEGHKLPVLPPKKFLGSFNKEFIEKRQQELSFWLHLLCSWDPASNTLDPRQSEYFKEFMLTNKEPLDKDVHGTPLPAKTDASSAPTSQDGGNEALYNTPKTSLDDFELLKVIGKGSYGKVTLVRKKDSKKLFAMKSLNKSNVKRRNQVEHTRTERRVLGRAKHPFIVHLHYAFQTSQKLYFVLDYCPGGELFFHLSRMEKFEEPMAKFYAAEIALALEHLHDLGVVYRDLKPENILFDQVGHVLLADFGLAKEGITDGAEGTNSMCGTPEYLPPEILDRVGHGTAVDWWALGMVLYEMLTGLPPWYTRNRQKLFDRVRNAPLTFPDEVGPAARSLISGLLTRDPNERLGSRSADDVKNHEFFNDINWDDLYARKIAPPFNPCESTSNFEETKNFEPEFTKMQINSVENSALGSIRVSDASRPSMTFQGFTYNTPNDLNSMSGSVGRG
ncbi:Agc protein kinase, partial [Globisporangium splendens]